MSNAFSDFVRLAFGDDHETLAQLQGIAGRLLSAQPNAAEQVYLHTGVGDDGRWMFFEALGDIFASLSVTETNVDGAFGGTHNPGHVGKQHASYDALAQREAPASLTFLCNVLIVWNESAECRVVDKITDAWLKGVTGMFGQTHILCLDGMPEGLSEAALRRVKQIHWKRSIPADLRDAYSMRQLRNDPDFLIWLVDGLRLSQAAP